MERVVNPYAKYCYKCADRNDGSKNVQAGRLVYKWFLGFVESGALQQLARDNPKFAELFDCRYAAPLAAVPELATIALAGRPGGVHALARSLRGRTTSL